MFDEGKHFLNMYFIQKDYIFKINITNCYLKERKKEILDSANIQLNYFIKKIKEIYFIEKTALEELYKLKNKNYEQ